MALILKKEKVDSSIFQDFGLGLPEPLSSMEGVGFCPYLSLGKDGKVDWFLGLLPG